MPSQYGVHYNAVRLHGQSQRLALCCCFLTCTFLVTLQDLDLLNFRVSSGSFCNLKCRPKCFVTTVLKEDSMDSEFHSVEDSAACPLDTVMVKM